MYKSLLILLALALMAANHVAMSAEEADEERDPEPEEEEEEDEPEPAKKSPPKKAAKEEEEFDGVGIGLVFRPNNCDQKTRRGDLVRVTFNVSTGYQGPQGQGFEKRYEKEPLEFVLGAQQMIRGFEVGVMEMCVGEVRYLTVPEKYAYGDNGLGLAPSRATFYFFVKLHSFEPLPPQEGKPLNAFRYIDGNNDHSLSHDEVKDFLRNSGYQDEAGDHGIKQMMRDIFREEDKDNNGYITFKEFGGPKHDYVH